MAREYRLTTIRKLANKLVVPLVRLGLGPRRTHLLTVAGRKTGKPYTTPVNLVWHDDATYLVAPYGEVSWVRNARAAGEVSLRRGRTTMRRRLQELSPADAAPVLQDYWRQNMITRPYFEVKDEGDIEGFRRDASRHPVFRLLPA